MKKKKLLLILILIFGIITLFVQAQDKEIKLKVVGPDGVAIDNALVRVYIPHRGSGFVVKVNTGKEGQAKFDIKRGQIIDRIILSKEGYYESEYGFPLDYMKTGVGADFEDNIFLMRKIINPIPMYARKDFLIELPEYGKEIGFDLLVSDWIAPHGEGKRADIYFYMEGYWNNKRDRDATLRIRFNENDGIMDMSSYKYSSFISLYNAPESGYLEQMEWRRGLIPNPEKIPGQKSKRIGEEWSHNSYCFRIRTILDDNGKIISCLYGKIYDGINFYGVSEDERYDSIKFTYYLNPNILDTNLEFDLDQNLFRIEDAFKKPRKP